MKKTTSQIADEVLEKTARTRGAKEFIKSVIGRAPGLRTRGKSLEDIEMLARERGVELPRRVSRIPQAVEKYRGALGPERIREAISYRHGPRKGEVLLPSALDYEGQAFSRAPVKGVTFRGNPRPPRGSGPYWGTPHPDVGAQYAREKVIGLSSKPSGKLFAYKTPSLKGSTIGPSDHVPAHLVEGQQWRDVFGVRGMPQLTKRRQALIQEELSVDVQRQLRELKQRRGIRRRGHKPRESYELSGLARRQQELPHSLRYSKNYERIIPEGLRPRAIGQYKVRPSRTSEGLPAFAVSDVAGRPAAEMFEGLTKKRSPLFSDFR